MDGVLLGHYTASYYQTRGKLTSLITVKKFEFRREAGVLFSVDMKYLAACLDFVRPSICWKLVQVITSNYELGSTRK